MHHRNIRLVYVELNNPVFDLKFHIQIEYPIIDVYK